MNNNICNNACNFYFIEEVFKNLKKIFMTLSFIFLLLHKKKKRNKKIQFWSKFRIFETRRWRSLRGLPKVIGQGIYMRESSARSRSMQGVASRQIEREREKALVEPVCIWCDVLLLRLFSVRTREIERKRERQSNDNRRRDGGKSERAERTREKHRYGTEWQRKEQRDRKRGMDKERMSVKGGRWRARAREIENPVAWRRAI